MQRHITYYNAKKIHIIDIIVTDIHFHHSTQIVLKVH